MKSGLSATFAKNAAIWARFIDSVSSSAPRMPLAANARRKCTVAKS